MSNNNNNPGVATLTRVEYSGCVKYICICVYFASRLTKKFLAKTVFKLTFEAQPARVS